MAVGRAEVAAVQWGDLGFGLLEGGPGSVLQHPRELKLKKHWEPVGHTVMTQLPYVLTAIISNSKGN